MHELLSASHSNHDAYTAQIAPGLRQAPFQIIAGQIHFLQLNQTRAFENMTRLLGESEVSGTGT